MNETRKIPAATAAPVPRPRASARQPAGIAASDANFENADGMSERASPLIARATAAPTMRCTFPASSSLISGHQMSRAMPTVRHEPRISRMQPSSSARHSQTTTGNGNGEARTNSCANGGG